MQHPSNESGYPEALIRAVEPEDYPAIQTIYAQPNAYAGTLQMPYPSAKMWKERVSHSPSGSHTLVACVDEVPVGHIGLMLETNPRRRHIGHIGMAVHDEYAGRGIGELLLQSVLFIADNWLNLSRLELTVYVDNSRAVSLYKRNNFEVEGQLRHYAFRDGNFVDALMMARFTTPG